MSLLPYHYPLNSNEKISDGSYLKLPTMCSGGVKPKCRKFYKTLAEQDDGFLECPYGLTCYKTPDRYGPIVFSGLRVIGFFDERKTKSKFKNGFSPIMAVCAAAALVKSCEIKVDETISVEEPNEVIKVPIEASEEQVSVNEIQCLLHEIRKLTRQTKDSSRALLGILDKAPSSCEVTSARNEADKLKMIADFASKRMDFFQYRHNPASVSWGKKGKETCIKLLKAAIMHLAIIPTQKGFLVKLVSKVSSSDIEILDSFHLVPFILLENAIKYSKVNSWINLVIWANHKSVHLDVKSVGPIIQPHEEPLVFEEGFRTHFAQTMITSGTGQGLTVAKQICDQHHFSISARTLKDFGNSFGKVSISLTIPSSYSC